MYLTLQYLDLKPEIINRIALSIQFVVQMVQLTLTAYRQSHYVSYDSQLILMQNDMKVNKNLSTLGYLVIEIFQ